MISRSQPFRSQGQAYAGNLKLGSREWPRIWPLWGAQAKLRTALHSHSSGLLISSLRLQSRVLRSQSGNGIGRGQDSGVSEMESCTESQEPISPRSLILPGAWLSQEPISCSLTSQCTPFKFCYHNGSGIIGLNSPFQTSFRLTASYRPVAS